MHVGESKKSPLVNAVLLTSGVLGTAGMWSGLVGGLELFQGVSHAHAGEEERCKGFFGKDLVNEARWMIGVGAGLTVLNQVLQKTL